MLRYALIAMAGLLAAAVGRLSAEEAVFSGPQPGEELPPLRVLAGTGDSQVGEVDFVEQADNQAVLFVFVHEMTRPSAALMRVLMNYGEMRIADGLFPATIRLTDDPSSSRSLRPRREGSAAYGISPDGKEGPGSYGLNRNVGMTVLVGNAGRVTASFPLVQPSVTDARAILAEIVKLIGGEVPTEIEIEFLRMSPYVSPRFRNNGAAPSDPKLRAKICAVLRAGTEPQALDAAAADIEAYVGADPHRQRQLGEASRLLLNQRYQGREALLGDSLLGDRFRGWVQQYGSPSAADAAAPGGSSRP
jgi:hypothetical protein